MEGEALLWYQDVVDGSIFNSWDSFVKALLARFGPTAYDDPMEALTRLKQTSTVAIYKAQFESLSNRLKGLSDRLKLSCFMTGMKDEIRLPIRMLNPINLNAAFSLAKIQEEYLWASRKSWKYNGLSGGKIQQEKSVDSTIVQRRHIPVKKVFSSQMDEKRRRGLCYHCDEKWNPTHKCKNLIVHLLQVDQEVSDPSGVNEDELSVGDEDGHAVVQEEGEEGVEVSLNAISGYSTRNAMRLHGRIGACAVEILVDSGSTHNFLDPLVVQKAKLRIERDSSLQVRVDDGTKVLSRGKGEEVVRIQGSKFSIPFDVLSLGGCDIVLGVQWLKTLGSIHWCFTKMSMSFRLGKEDVVLQGISTGTIDVLMGDKWLKPDFVNGQGWFLQLMGVDQKVAPEFTPGIITELLNAYPRVFFEPVAFSPNWAFNHPINLKEWANPVFGRPYRYPHYQKAKIEKIVKELLASAVVRHNQKSFFITCFTS
ncbi:hypothetical protein F2P56_012987 [Juglans regia]|uniref:Retrotransposon gag domain-containing protein n=1 Tax=Juglans regia TaxID=51240 RepID=A0A834CZ94_JUGRE|nr:hypothetical protein F2P56_012987 [Juglans regia]